MRYISDVTYKIYLLPNLVTIYTSFRMYLFKILFKVLYFNKMLFFLSGSQ